MNERLSILRIIQDMSLKHTLKAEKVSIALGALPFRCHSSSSSHLRC